MLGGMHWCSLPLRLRRTPSVVICAAALVLTMAVPQARADKVYSQNKKANKQFEQGEYAKALELYDQALVESPDNPKLRINRGSAHYKLGQFDQAVEDYKSATEVEDKGALSDLHYNKGNALFMQGEQLYRAGNQQAMEKFTAARESYIEALDKRPSDRDAKWNLQLTQARIKQLKQQQQQQQKQNKDNKQKKDDQQKKQQGENQQDQDKQKKQQQDRPEDQDQQKQDRNQQQQQQQKKNQEQEQQKPQPRPRKQEEEMKKEEAQRLLRQFADDAKELNKPPKRIRARGKKTEKDW